MKNLAMGVAAIILAGHGPFDLPLNAEMCDAPSGYDHLWNATNIDQEASSLRGEAATDATSLQVLAHGITFASDLRKTGTHRYPIARDTSNRGFINGTDPINAIEIVLLENLHPRFENLMVESTFTDRDQAHFLGRESFGLNGVLLGMDDVTPVGAFLRAANPSDPLGTIDHSLLIAGLSDRNSGSDFPAFTSDLFDSTNTSDNESFGWSRASDQSGSWSGGFITDSGSGNNDLTVVPLPLPVTLTGCGIITALLVRRRMRN